MPASRLGSTRRLRLPLSSSPLPPAWLPDASASRTRGATLLFDKKTTKTRAKKNQTGSLPLHASLAARSASSSRSACW